MAGREQVLHVALDSWLMLDRRMAEVALGDRIRVPIQAWPHRITKASVEAPLIESLGLNYYHIRGRVDLLQGLPALIHPRVVAYLDPESIPSELVDRWVDGEFELEVHPYPLPAASFVREYAVERIALETQNWRARRIDENRPIRPGRHLHAIAKLARERRLGHEGLPVERTDSSEDDNGVAHYVLDLMGGPSAVI